MRHLFAITAVVAFTMVAACQGELPTAPDANAAETVGVDGQVGKDYGQQGDGTVVVPFKAWFYSNGGTVVDTQTCGEFPNVLNTQNGEGEATGLGRMLMYGQFCQNVADYLDGVDPTDTAPWQTVGYGTFTAADGDELWTTGGGEIVSSDKPGYKFEFSDPFVIVGGTGRFEGASGSGVSEGYVMADGSAGARRTSICQDFSASICAGLPNQ